EGIRRIAPALKWNRGSNELSSVRRAHMHPRQRVRSPPVRLAKLAHILRNAHRTQTPIGRAAEHDMRQRIEPTQTPIRECACLKQFPALERHERDRIWKKRVLLE